MPAPEWVLLEVTMRFCRPQIQEETERSQIFCCTESDESGILKETERSSGHLIMGMKQMAKGKTTRERIVTEAANLFNQRGFEGSSMSDVMAVTGLEKGGIYRHLSSKEELAAKAFDYAWKSAFETRTHGSGARSE